MSHDKTPGSAQDPANSPAYCDCDFMKSDVQISNWDSYPSDL